VTAIVSLYFNVFVLVIQSFIKVALLNALAPTQTNEPAFVIAQVLVLAFFVLMGIVATLKFRPLARAWSAAA
jgi:TRAP-type C4-dicarboxylate transport system permease small subunit